MKKYHKLTLEALQASSRVKVDSFEVFLDVCSVHIWTKLHSFRVTLTDSKKEVLKQQGVDTFLKWNEEAVYLLNEEECYNLVAALHSYIFKNKK